ncbi:MAG: redoxin domain-containing protein [Candidatus Obscuribacter sp.]|nr:redoxin domain-containing protein [Candidatus Obscuribacter sp.]
MTPRTHKALGVFTDMLQVGKSSGFDMPSTKDLKTLKDNVKPTDYKGKWLALFFYPLDFTFVCPTELKAFSDLMINSKAGAEVLAISLPTVFTARAWINPANLKVDWDQSTTFSLQTSPKMSAAICVLMEDKGVALRGLFIIDQDGVLQYQVVHSSTSALRRRNPPRT